MKSDAAPMSVGDTAYFNSLFADNADPWGFWSRWFAQRKRALTLACLPSPRYQSGYEPGCANCELSAALAGRCERLLVSDGSDHPVALDRKRLEAFTNVAVAQRGCPRRDQIKRLI